MAHLINEAKRMQFLAGIINESKLNEEESKYKDNYNPYDSNVKGHGKVSFRKILTDDELEKFAEKMGRSVDELYFRRSAHTNMADGQYYEDTIVVDSVPPNNGGKTDEEMKQIASTL